MTNPLDSFPPDVAAKLKTYVYRLLDPRNGETFYVGKGAGDRVFTHARGERLLDEDDLDSKMKRIRQIRLAGFEVAHVIHRHGMDEATALEVEAALIDAYPGLTNLASVRVRPRSSLLPGRGRSLEPLSPMIGCLPPSRTSRISPRMVTTRTDPASSAETPLPR